MMNRYFTESFPDDWRKLAFLEPNSIVREHILKDPTALVFGGPDWRNVSSDLGRISPERREPFVLCLFMAVVTDQALHAHFPDAFPTWQAATRFPKFGWSGFGIHNENPLKIVSAAEASGLLDMEVMQALIPEFVDLCKAQVAAFFQSHRLNIRPIDFFRAVVADEAFSEPAGALLPQIKAALDDVAGH